MSAPSPDTLIRYTDLYPATVTPMPPGVPLGVKVRAVITDKYLTLGWIYGGGDVQRLDIDIADGGVGPEVTYDGGTVTGVTDGVTTAYTVSRKGVCSICGSGRKMTGWDPFPSTRYTEEPRQQVALVQRTGVNRQMTGLVPPRYSRR